MLPEILTLTLEHLKLVAITVAIAAALGIPWAALLARLMANGKMLGYFTPLLYQANAKTAGQPLGAAALTDITTGGNATAAAGGYKAAAGFDAVTGWGSPNGANLMKLL